MLCYNVLQKQLATPPVFTFVTVTKVCIYFNVWCDLEYLNLNFPQIFPSSNHNFREASLKILPISTSQAPCY